MDLWTPAIATPTRATTSPNTPTRISVPVVLLEPSPEKNSDSRMIAPNSATEADASTSWPKRELVTFASFRTGKITLTDEAASTIATNSGDLTNPPTFRPRPIVIAIANESTNPIVVSLRTRPRSRSTSISRPERNSSNASPIRARVETAQVGLGQAQPGRADHDAEHELEYYRRQPEPREETERERGEQADRDDAQQVCVVHSGHVEVLNSFASCTGREFPARRAWLPIKATSGRGLPSRRDRGIRLAGLPRTVQPGRSVDASGLKPPRSRGAGLASRSAYRGWFELIWMGGTIGDCGRS